MLAWSQAVTTGLFTLLGAAIGIALGGVVEVSLERRRERALLRQAKRLVAEELFLVCSHVSHLVRSRRHPFSLGSETAPLFPNAAWLEYRAALALGLPDKEYMLLSRVAALVSMVRADLEEGEPATPLPSDVLAAAVRLEKLTRVAYWSLTGEQWDTFRARDDGADRDEAPAPSPAES